MPLRDIMILFKGNFLVTNVSENLNHNTMLQKLSKCEVKVYNTKIDLLLNFPRNQFWQNLNIKNCLLQFQRLTTLNFGKFGTWKMAQTYWNWNSKPLKVPKMTLFDLLNAPKIWFHVKSEWQGNCEISTKWCLSFTLEKFLEHCVQCGNFRDFLSFRFYVKSKLECIEVLIIAVFAF